MRSLAFLVATPLLLATLPAQAQWQDRLYPFAELTDEMRARIDLKDGSVEDWLEVRGEPTLTPLDFVTSPFYSGYEPSSYDFRIWLAWQADPPRLFVASEIVDDIHTNKYDRKDPRSRPGGDACVRFYIDGDKSGGGTWLDAHSESNMQQAQIYAAFAGTYDNDSNLDLFSVSNEAPWVHQVPYADGGGAIVDSQPILSVVEFYVTPFDRLVWQDPEQSVPSDLTAGETIGFALGMVDVDTEEGEFGPPPESAHYLFGPDASFDDELFFDSDNWAHGILLGADHRTGDTAVERVTWGRIKAGLSK